MAELLVSAISRDIIPEYARKLLSAFPDNIRKSVKFDKELISLNQPLIEPLSEREFDVLYQMAAGLSYKEIADKLVVSINTVRHHTRNIYSKLNVNSRTQAVGRARELDML